jgi:hypothetical protein
MSAMTIPLLCGQIKAKLHYFLSQRHENAAISKSDTKSGSYVEILNCKVRL